MNPLIKWPGGKAREIAQVEHLIPRHRRYVEPFLGGGAMYFHLRPEQAALNDLSSDLMDFYALVKAQDPELRRHLLAYHQLMTGLLGFCDGNYPRILSAYRTLATGNDAAAELDALLSDARPLLDSEAALLLVSDHARWQQRLRTMALDKLHRTVRNEARTPFTEEDLRENLITGFVSGLYMYFRDVYNDLLLGRLTGVSQAYRTANFYFIREYCYGSMFRYNRAGEFNIPYGGMSYNRKDLGAKVAHIFSPDMQNRFRGTQLCCMDFEAFLDTLDLTEDDFLFLDPPYDSDFSDYEGRAFTQDDQRRLARVLRATPAKFLLIIQNTAFIHDLYQGRFSILCSDKTYTYNVRSRNARNVEYLTIANFPITS